MRLIRFFKRDLAHEIEQWVGEELLTQTQAQGICARYDLVYGNRDSSTFGHSLLLVLGCLFFGIAAIILIGHNWEGIPRALRVVTLLGSTALANGVGLTLFLKDRRAGAVASFMLGSLLYGASIMLIAQIYHLGEHYPDGIFWWALGVLPIAMLTKSRALMVLTLVLAVVWMMVETRFGNFPWLFGGFILAAAYFLKYLNRSAILFAMTVLATGVFAQYVLMEFVNTGTYSRFGAENVLLGFGYALALFVYSRWLATRESNAAQDYSVLIDVWLLRFAVISLLVMTYTSPWSSLLKAHWEYPPGTMTVAGTISAGCLSVWMGVSAMRTRAGYLVPTLALAYIVLSALVMFAPGLVDPVTAQIVTTLAVLVVAVRLITLGIGRGITHYYFTGVFVVLAIAVTRYFDLVNDYITASVLFAAAAAILIGSARYWKRARNNINNAQETVA